MIRLKQQPKAQQLTQEEIAYIYSRYYNCEMEGNRICLNQVKHMPDNEIYLFCDQYAHEPFADSMKEEWRIEREGFEIKVKCKRKDMGYIIDTDSGDINLLRNNGMRTHLGVAVYGVQFLNQYFYDYPVYIERGHWANRKTPLQLGIAVPNKRPLYEALNKLYDNDKALVQDWFNNKMFHGIALNNVHIFNEYLIEINKQLIAKG